MIHVKRAGPNRLEIEFRGKLDSAAMTIALDDMVSKAEGIENGRMLYRIDEFRLPTLAAIGVELKRLPAMFRLMRQFKRVAVLADKEWVQTISEIEGALIPGLKIKAFDLDETDEAERWLAKSGD